jgi:hypothetical protein
MAGGPNITDNINVLNTITTTNIVSALGSDGDITVTPNGTGQVILDGFTMPNSDGASGQVLTTNGSAVLSFSTPTATASRSRTAVGTTPFSAAESHDILGVTLTSSSAVTINLPQISGLSKSTVINIVDEGGNSSNNNITINSFAGDTIVGDTSILVNNDYISITVYDDGSTGWFIL